MADRKITQFTDLTAPQANGNMLVPVVNPGAGASAGGNRKMTLSNLRKWTGGSAAGAEIVATAQAAEYGARAAQLAAEAAASTAGGIPQYPTIAAAQAVTVPAPLARTLVDGRIYHRVAADPNTSSSYQDASGQWFSAVEIRTKGPIDLWAGMGQSEYRGSTNPAAASGNRSGQSNVLVYSRGNPNVPDGWHAVGPEDVGYVFNTSSPAVGSPWYQAAVARAQETGGVVCMVAYALGGRSIVDFIQGGEMWAGFQASWKAALDAPLPGRGGKTLRQLNKILADEFDFWQGSGDADYKLGTPGCAASADDWVLKVRQFFNSLQTPSGTESLPVISARTKILVYEMLYGAMSGGAPGAGSPTDSRNRDLHKLVKSTSSKRDQIGFVRMHGINQATNVIDPEALGSFDFLHLNGGSYGEVACRRISTARALDPGRQTAITFVHNTRGTAVLHPDGRYEADSLDITTPNNIAVADGAGFRTSFVSWVFPMPPGYELEVAPTVLQAQCSPIYAGSRVTSVTTTQCSAYAVSTASIAAPGVLRLSVRGRWKVTEI